MTFAYWMLIAAAMMPDLTIRAGPKGCGTGAGISAPRVDPRRTILAGLTQRY